MDVTWLLCGNLHFSSSAFEHQLYARHERLWTLFAMFTLPSLVLSRDSLARTDVARVPPMRISLHQGDLTVDEGGGLEQYRCESKHYRFLLALRWRPALEFRGNVDGKAGPWR